MSRNLDRRIELMFPILDKDCFADVKSILDTYFLDNAKAMELKSDGSWEPIRHSKKSSPFEAQSELYKKYKRLNEKRPKNTEKQFEVRRK